MKNSTLFTLIGWTSMIVAIIGMALHKDNVLSMIIISNLWIIGGAILQKLKD